MDNSSDLPSTRSRKLLDELSVSTHTSLVLKDGFKMTEKDSTDVVVVCPGLSMWHSAGCSSMRDVSRKHAEQHAVSLLARPVSVKSEGMARLLLWNLYSSFATLVESRLHAYTSLLARHSASSSHTTTALDAMERKILTILTVGDNLASERLTSHFQPTHGNCITFKATFDLSIRIPKGSKQFVLRVALSAAGSIDEGDDSGNRIEVTLDLQELLKNMIDQAARVVSAVVEIATSPKVLSGDVPPPDSVPTTLKTQHGSLDLLGETTATGLPVVSPNLGACGPPPELFLPSLDLLDDRIDNLSADQCANIVDTCLGAEFPQPARKRFRASS